MAAGTWTFTNAGRTSLLNGDFDLDSDSFKIALHTSTSNIGASSTAWSGVTNEVSSTDTGYTAGGIAITLSLTGTTTVKITTASTMQWTAGSANLTARWAVIYEVGGNVLCYCLLDDTPADVTATEGNTLTITPDTNGIFTLS